MEEITLVTVLLFAAHLLVILGYGTRVVMKRRPVGVSLAWLVVIVSVPYAGAVFYQLFGERRLGEKRGERMRALLPNYLAWLEDLSPDCAVDWGSLTEPCHPLHDLAVGTIGIPALAGNRLRLLDDAQRILRAMVADITSARSTVHMEFYIWNSGGSADDVADALVVAAQRGVSCRLLLDSVGSADFLGGSQARRLRDAGVQVVAALPVGPIRSLFVRADHRLHRKIVVVDGEIAYTGSLNLVDPRFFKTDAGVGSWVDTMVRLQGPAVEALAVVFVADWELETGEGIDELAAGFDIHPSGPIGTTNVQALPSGPGFAPEAIHQMLLMALYSARHTLVLTTPYFVPDDALVTALKSAALRGVEVTVIVPERIDSILVRFASRAHFDELLAVGVRIAQFREGLLHSKTITVDDEITVFGSVNMDMRSFWLNFEISLFIYDREFTAELRALQHTYLHGSTAVELDTWRQRPVARRFLENTALLFGPLL